jgi:hypothetical protein
MKETYQYWGKSKRFQSSKQGESQMHSKTARQTDKQTTSQPISLKCSVGVAHTRVFNVFERLQKQTNKFVLKLNQA